MIKRLFFKLLILILVPVVVAMSQWQDNSDLNTGNGSPQPFPRLLSAEASAERRAQGRVSYTRDVKPILDSRCVVCHACYDAPCQLKLSAFEGLDRGASKKPVYDTERLEAAAPTRLFIDAADTEQWRKKSFFPMLNEWRQPEPPVKHGANDASADWETQHSILARLLRLKQKHPLPASGKLDDSFKFELDRTLECPRLDELEQFQSEHPLWGMPYAMPGLSERQQSTIMRWLREGARFEPRPPLPAQSRLAIEQWENFFNGRSLKERLVARYLYEHLFIGHLHFKGFPETEFYRLVRSRTPPGRPIAEIETVRPYEAPANADFYYRLRPVVTTLVDKNHFVYELSGEKMQRLRALFFEPDYPVTALPSYQTDAAANPFKTFAQIPVRSRYQFLLDDAHFFFSGFIKGPVCRGQVAINVIRDRFWVVFIDPDADFIGNNAAFLTENAPYLSLPGSGGDDIGVLDMGKYLDWVRAYQARKQTAINQSSANAKGVGLAMIWNGGGRDKNAALTVFRHFDNATVVTGFVGATPLTGWVVDYPIFERIHYLLVAGFNVFGSSEHQVATRRYMDYLRRDAENNLLRFMPADQRRRIYDNWYQGLGADLEKWLRTPLFSTAAETAVSYRSSDYVGEFFDRARERLGTAAGRSDPINRCRNETCKVTEAEPLQQETDRIMRRLAKLSGKQIQALPELSFVRVLTQQPEQDPVYTLVVDRALSNVSFMFGEKLRRVPEHDRLTVAPGFLGSYPNFFFAVAQADLEDFVRALQQAQSATGVNAFYRRFGIRRSNPDIWRYVDWFNARHRQQNGTRAGLFDMNRYQNL